MRLKILFRAFLMLVAITSCGSLSSKRNEMLLPRITPPHASRNIISNGFVANGSLTIGATVFERMLIIDSITPSRGPISGGTIVVIHGNYFSTHAKVFFCGILAEIVKRENATAITALTPDVRTKCAAGPADISVQNPNGTKITKIGAFEFF